MKEKRERKPRLRRDNLFKDISNALKVSFAQDDVRSYLEENGESFSFFIVSKNEEKIEIVTKVILGELDKEKEAAVIKDLVLSRKEGEVSLFGTILASGEGIDHFPINVMSVICVDVVGNKYGVVFSDPGLTGNIQTNYFDPVKEEVDTSIKIRNSYILSRISFA